MLFTCFTIYSLPGSYYYNHNFVDYYNHNFDRILGCNRNFGRTVGFGHITSFDHSFIIADPLDLLLAVVAQRLAELQFEVPKLQN